jgi:hypothetical protein
MLPSAFRTKATSRPDVSVTASTWLGVPIAGIFTQPEPLYSSSVMPPVATFWRAAMARPPSTAAKDSTLSAVGLRIFVQVPWSNFHIAPSDAVTNTSAPPRAPWPALSNRTPLGVFGAPLMAVPFSTSRWLRASMWNSICWVRWPGGGATVCMPPVAVDWTSRDSRASN